jgi:TRAP-type C4-dicarboxylate transport system substrate-binding protein
LRGHLGRIAAIAAAAALAIALGACGSSSSSSSSSSPGKVLRLGYVTTPTHPYGIAVAAFAKRVQEASGGKLTVTPLPNYQGGDVPLLNDVSGGTVEMAAPSTAIFDTRGVKVFQPLQAPFLITNYGLEKAVLDGDIGKSMLSSANGPAKLGLVGLGVLEGGLRKPLGRVKCLASPGDFQGAKIRAPQSAVLSAGLKALGAEPTPLAVGDVFPALQNGTVDGMEANLGLIQTNKYYEVAKCVTQDVNLWPFPAAVVINKSQWDALSSQEQGWLRDAGAKLADDSLAVFTNPAPGAPNFAKLLCGEGLTFAFAGKANQAALANAVKPAYTQLDKDPEVAAAIAKIQALKASSPPPAAAAPLPAGCTTKQAS